MPKIVDNYVLERKIGNGQFGDVFKGYNKLNNQDIAIKCVKRASLKGKFHELLENEIRVLRTCNNENIIKLYDIKKTANNFYLMLEYCNEGDLSQYLKEKKYLPEEEAIEFFIQILNSFKTLVKNKIMHRDFKLANILKHDGNIKIADFGFSKLLGNDNMASTMLGSPLNMAPEVLNGQEYSNKADIWSIGTVFYELLFGKRNQLLNNLHKAPFTASNMIDLIKNIQNKTLEIPRKINNVSNLTEDVLRKMLVVDPKKRIEWDDLFNHNITHYLDDKIKKDLEETINCDGSLQMNMSRFYIKNNKVIAHPSEINKKQELNNYVQNVTKGQTQGQYQGPLIKRKTDRDEEEKQEQQDQQDQNQPDNEENKTDSETISTEESQREKQIRIKKKNANRILHERNIYVFLASVAEDAMNNNHLKNSDIVGFLLVKKLLQLVDYLANKLKQKQNIFQLESWENFVDSKDFKDIFVYIEKEHDVFRMYFQSMYERLAQNPRIKNMPLDEETRIALSSNISISIDKVLKKFIKEYANELFTYIVNQAQNNQNNEAIRIMWVHADRIMDCFKMEQVFIFEDSNNLNQFNFKQYYDEDDKMDIVSLIKKVEKKMNQM